MGAWRMENNRLFLTPPPNNREDMEEKEYILCAAIWYKDLPTQKFLPKNIHNGMVVLGHRHGHCIDTVKMLSELRTVRFSPDAVGESVQGFLTNTNIFVERDLASEIAFNSGQIKEKKKTLFSEDLY
jgi:hypothetical protein